MIIEQALDHLPADYCALLDDDSTVSSNFVSELIEEFKCGDKVGAVGPLVRWSGANDEPAGKVQMFGGWFPAKTVRFRSKTKLPSDLDKPQSRKVDYVVGPAVMFSTRALRAIGPYDPRHSVYGEELDMGARLEAANLESRVRSQAVMFHDGRGVDAGGTGSATSNYLRARNAIFNFLKHERLRTPNSLLRITRFAFKTALAPKGASDLSARLAGFRGIWHAFMWNQPHEPESPTPIDLIDNPASSGPPTK